MPTAPKLIAAILICALGYVAAMQAVANVPDHVPVASVPFIAAGLGLLWGWRFLGRGVGRGVTTGLGIGLTTSAAMALSTLLTVGFIQMIKRSLRMSYDNPVEALQDWIAISLSDAGAYLLKPEVIGILVVGGLLAGLICELSGRRWT